MPASVDRSARVPTVRYWPFWSSATLLVAGGAIALLEMDSLLFFAGLLFLALGLYGFQRHRPSSVRSTGRPAAPPGSSRSSFPGRGTP